MHFMHRMHSDYMKSLFSTFPPVSAWTVLTTEAFSVVQFYFRYIYTDTINLQSFDQACELCYIAKKYMLPHLVGECTNYLWQDLFPKNACRAYEFAKLFEEPVLMDKCLQVSMSSFFFHVCSNTFYLSVRCTNRSAFKRESIEGSENVTDGV